MRLYARAVVCVLREREYLHESVGVNACVRACMRVCVYIRIKIKDDLVKRSISILKELVR